MVNATNVDATAVNTIQWLSDPELSIVVPVYQRQYRWDIGGCEQLLADIRAVADADENRTHFLASILSSRGSAADAAELVLIDGQQRVTTLMLLVAALQHTVAGHDSVLEAHLQRVLVRSSSSDRTKLRPHSAWAGLFEDVVLGRTRDKDGASRFENNYAFFRSQIRLDEAPRIWRGLQRLEHVAIGLGADANAQQIFESLNSTGEPLRDHELIHNYMLMGLSHEDQTEIEDTYWLPIEQNTGDSIAEFWRHYLVMKTGRELVGAGQRAVYEAFRTVFPVLTIETLREHATQWRAFSELYRVLLDPNLEPDAVVARQLAYVNTFGRAMHPLVLAAYFDWRADPATRGRFIATLESVQSLLLRRSICALPSSRLVARLCRAYAEGAPALNAAFARITPSDVRMRAALKHTELPQAVYVLGRISEVDDTTAFGIEYVFPLTVADTWSPDGHRTWADFTDDEQNSHRALAKTLGNLALLEDELGISALDTSFPQKRALYASSAVASTAVLADVEAWNTAQIAARTANLTTRFLQIWQRATDGLIDDDGLTPILDAKRRRGFPPGWDREWAYVEYAGEHWEVYDVKYLFNRVFKRLWADARASVLAYTAAHGGPVYDAMAWNGQWDTIGDGAYLYMGWDSGYMLTAVQGVLLEADLAAEVFVKYSYIGDAMRD